MHHTPIIKAHDVAGAEPEGQLKPGVIRQGMKAPERGVGLTHVGIGHIGEGSHGVKRPNRRHTLTTQRIDDGRREAMIDARPAVKKDPAPGAQNLVVIGAGCLEFLNQCGAIGQRRFPAIGLVDQAMQKLKAWRDFPCGVGRYAGPDGTPCWPWYWFWHPPPD